MPAVNLSLQQTPGILYTIPGTPLRLLFTCLGFTSLGVLLLVFKRRYKSQTPTYTSQLDASPTTANRPWISEKSRGVIFQNEVMSLKQPSGASQLGADRNLGEGQKKHTMDMPRDRDSSEGHQGDMAAPVNIEAGMPLIFKSGPPPPPPLTPPTLLIGVFTFQDRRLSAAASTMGALDTSFFHQPNPDYTLSDSPESNTTALAHDQDSPSIPRRRSYAKMLPLGPAHTDSEHDGASFAPSSFPSSSPILPLAPHESLDSREIDVKGEIISVTDDSGAGWKRHTRVYGGGVCLACLASGSQGGFYGDNVPLEHRR
ncbi:uncharacterized protein F4812DRAFT_101250 [Daldinia caldariorum]|uniref:uncharacterized protein n=1 Tax=Daldinia caldariorum TaxID=326644 RepID=UPI002008D1A9|nr:uncharacterized protein F4812DRAFT_101250 [Daldinia caldariorum]KAI1466257.1 hypothetical protein F4812DRAFT_101250 [Daldinia caldariorum]